MTPRYRSIVAVIKALCHWFFCQSRLAKLVHNDVLGIVLPGIVGVYYLTTQNGLQNALPIANPENESENQAFVVTFVTYGAKVCEAFDRDAANIARTLFREFVRRLEIECTLLALKKWRAHHQEQSKKAKSKTGKRGASHEIDEDDAGEQQDNEEQEEASAADRLAAKSPIINAAHPVRKKDHQEKRGIGRDG